MKFHKTILILVCLTMSTVLYGQIGTSFWFAASDVSQEHYNNSVPLNLHVTAIYTTHVTISRPADPGFTPIEFDLNAQQSQTIRLDNILTVDEIETYARDKSAGNFVQNKGFLIESSPGEITAYYELQGRNNTDLIALKADNALGTEFWVSTQRKYKNHGYSDDYSGFVIVATEDGTTVTINPNGSNLAFHGTTPFTVNLDKGETFAVRAAGQAPGDHVYGVHVTSNKDIAVSVFDDSMQIDDGGGSWDIFSDQLVPIELVGLEYIILKGSVQDDAGDPKDAEAIFITATEDNTNIYIDGVLAGNIALAGGYFEYDIKNLSTHVRTSKPAYVNHITGYHSTPTRELGGAILPSIDKCTGSHSVTVKRSPASGFTYFNNLMVRNDTATGSPFRNQAIHNFTYSINGGPSVAINPNHFTYIMDSAFAFYDRTKAGGGAYYFNVSDNDILKVENSVARFHMGVMQGNGNSGCRYGYFSDFAASDAEAGVGGLTYTSDIFCNLNPIQLVAEGGRSYKWFAPYEPSLMDLVDSDSIAAPYFYPDTTGIYYFNVVVTGECNAKDTLQTEVIVNVEASNNFAFSSDAGCSPFAPTLTNLADDVVGVDQDWIIAPAVGNSYGIDQDTMPKSFVLELPENNSDSIQTHKVSLIVKGFGNSCPTKRTKDIKVLPNITAQFTIDDTIGCHPLTINLTNTSIGNIDSSGFIWDFGDLTQTFDLNPSHTYTNYDSISQNFTLKLEAESPFGCIDTAVQNITVHPRIRIAMAIDTSSVCSPLDLNVNPSNSIGVDTFFWRVISPAQIASDPDIDTTFVTPYKNLARIQHDDITILGPDTLSVLLWGTNNEGCRDTFPTKSVVVFPEVKAKFLASKDTICDGEQIIFDNMSEAYRPVHSWDFGDGAIIQDTTQLGKDQPHKFFNRNDPNSISYNVELTVISAFNCEDTKDTTIIVHPIVRAGFGMDYGNSCTPVEANFYNFSIGADYYEWDFGDDSTSTIADSSFIHVYWNENDILDTTYYPSLVAYNLEGCRDSVSRSVRVLPHVLANFSFKNNDSVGCAPFTAGFTNESTGSTSYLWDFGNGTSSTKATPLDRVFDNYTDADTTYPITLIAMNSFGCDDTVSSEVGVFAFIDANFNLPIADSCSPFLLRPENLSSAGAKVFEWELLQAGLTDNNQTPNFGTLLNNSTVRTLDTLSLLAYGSSIACADVHKVPIIVYPELDIDFGLDQYFSCQPFLSNITPNINITDGTTYEWVLDSTFYSAKENPPALTVNNLTPNNRTHTLHFSGRSKYGCRDYFVDSFEVYSLVDARFVIDQAGICHMDSFEVDRRTSQGGISTYEWTFNAPPVDNRTEEVFNYTFSNTGSALQKVPIKLKVLNPEGCSDSIIHTIDVYPQVRADFEVDSAEFCYPYPVQFINNTENASYYYWDFKDGTGSNKHTPLPHVFENFSYVDDRTFDDISLIARSQYNCYDTAYGSVLVYAKPNADFYFPVTVDCPPFNASMENNSEGFDLSYYWDFGDGEFSSAEQPSHTFTNQTSAIAEKNITLLITSGGGKECMDTVVRSLSVYPEPDVDFESDLWAGCSPLTVQLSSSSANISNMVWSLDDQPFSTLSNASYRLVNNSPDARVYEVKFKGASTYNCTADTTKTITVYPSPSAEFVTTPVVQTYNTELDRTSVTFYNQTPFQDNWAYTWKYGDGNTDAQANPQFEYAYGNLFWGPNENENEIPIELTSWNIDNPECRDSVTYVIQIKPPLPEVQLEEDIEGCEPLTIDFSAYTKYNYEDGIEWEFGIEGATSNEEYPVYTYDKEGTYTVRLQVEGDGGTNWDTRIITVHPKPEVSFTFNDSVAFVTSQTRPEEYINFYNHTKYGNSWEWYFENTDPDAVDAIAFNSTDKDPSFYFPEKGTYYPALISHSVESCSDTMISSKSIRILGEASVQFPTGFIVEPSGPADEYVQDQMDPRRTVFRPYAKGVDEYKLEIYNRWGVLVFVSEEVNRGWNGYIDGIPAKQDVYIWRAKGRFTNGEPFEMSGDVTLIRAVDGQVPSDY